MDATLNWKTECARRKAWRLRLGLSIEQLAASIGVSKPALFRWEEARRRPHEVFADRWLEALRAYKREKPCA